MIEEARDISKNREKNGIGGGLSYQDLLAKLRHFMSSVQITLSLSGIRFRIVQSFCTSCLKIWLILSFSSFILPPVHPIIVRITFTV